MIVTPLGRTTWFRAVLVLLAALLFSLAYSACAKVEQTADPTLPELPGRVDIQTAPTWLVSTWDLTMPGGAVLSGAGDTTLAAAPVGTYTLAWHSVPGFSAPRPNPMSQTVAAGGTIVFNGSYESSPNPTSALGTIVIQPAPALLDAPWSMTGPGGSPLNGTGLATILDMEVGSYTLTWGDVPGWTTPTPRQQTATLEAEQSLTFFATYVEAPTPTGTVVVQPLRDGMGAPWTLTGPNGYSNAGSSATTIPGLATGSYTVTWQGVAGWVTPTPAQETKLLAQSATVTFSGQYVQEPNPGGAPSITSVSGSPADGSEMQLAGQDFGSNALDVEWDGGSAGWIESSAVGTTADARPNWGYLYSGQDLDEDRVTTARAWSGSKSLICPTRSLAHPESWESTLYYRPASGTFRRVYWSFWMYFEPLVLGSQSGLTQTKFIAIACDACNGGAELADSRSKWHWVWHQSNLSNYADSYMENFCYQDCPSGRVQSDCNASAVPVGYSSAQYMMNYLYRGVDVPSLANTYCPTMNGWSRVEVWADSGTMGNADGELRLTVIKPGVGIRTGLHLRNVRFLTADSADQCGGTGRNEPDSWRRLYWYLFFDQAWDPQAQARANFYFDDVYIQIGTQARVEMGDAPRYQDCTRLEIQEPLTWSNSAVSMRVNRGGFARGASVYLFVIREDGTPSPGVPLVLQ